MSDNMIETNISLLTAHRGGSKQYESAGLAFDIQIPKSGKWMGWVFVKGGIPKAELDKLAWFKRPGVGAQRPGHYFEHKANLSPAQLAALNALLGRIGVRNGQQSVADPNQPGPTRTARRTTATTSKPLSEMLDSGYDCLGMTATSYTNNERSFAVQIPQAGKYKGWLFMRGGVPPVKFAETIPANLPLIGKQPPGKNFYYDRESLDAKARAAIVTILAQYAKPKAGVKPPQRSNKEALANSPVTFSDEMHSILDEYEASGLADPVVEKKAGKAKRESVRDKVRARYGIGS